MQNFLQKSIAPLCFLVLLCPPESLRAQSLLAATYDSPNEFWQKGEVTIEQALRQLEKKFDVSFHYETDLVRAIKLNKNTQAVTKESIQVALKQLLTPANLHYRKLDERYYLIIRNASPPKVRRQNVSTSPSASSELTVERRAGTVKLASSGDRSGAFTEKSIAGQVTDLSNGEGLPGVNIVVKGTTVGTVTDVEGNYRLTMADDAKILVFSSVGYINEEITIGNQTVINVSLAPDVQSLQEVVVVGYGTQQRKDITGSVASVKTEALEKIVTPSLDQALQGRTPGLLVSNSNGGAPGAAPTVRIRGSNSINSGNEPLYVIDGFPVYPNNTALRGEGSFRTDQLSPNTSNILSTINPNDIASIEVLKDASATAIYGSRGANGVIVITTKRGKEGGSRLNLDVYSGVNTITERYPVMNAGQYARLINEFNAAFDVAPTFTNDQVQAFDQNGGVDWQDQIFRTGRVNNVQLSTNGANNKVQYYLSGNYYNEEGIIKSSGLERFSLRANLDVSPSEKLIIGNSFTSSYTVEEAVPNGGRNPNTGPGVVFSALQFPPTDPVFNDDDSYFLFPTRGNTAFANPLAIVETQDITYQSLRSLGTFYLNYEFIPGLSGKINVGYDLLSRSERAYYPTTTLYGSEVGGAARLLDVFDVTWLTDFLLNYRKTIGVHQFNAVAGFSAQANTLERTLTGRNNFVTDAFGTANLGGGASEVIPQSSLDDWSIASWLGRINYSLLDRYLFTLSGRYDGSSRFGENNKFGFFPSGALGWRVSNEPFMQNISTISDLKFRVSYGVTGNQEIGLYRSLPRFITVGEVFGQDAAVGVRPANNGIPNPDLTWERTRQFDIGFDMTLFNDRVNITADYYNKVTEDLILEFPVAIESGFTSVLQNSGSVENRGIELAIGTNLAVGNLNISVNANYTYNNNNILDLGGQDTIIIGNTGRAHIIGQDLGTLYAMDFAGIWQSDEAAEAAEFDRKPGDPKFVDISQDGSYDLADDRTVIGVTQPTSFYGLSTAFNYKGIELSVFLQGSAGNLARGRTDIGGFGGNVGGFGGESNAFTSSLDHWTPTNPSNLNPALSSQDPLLNSSVSPSGRDFQSVDFLRLRNVTLAYTFPVTVLESWGISRLRVYASGQNLLTFTEYTGQDPESGSTSAYPFARNFRVGLNLGF
ncbi:SusC/RagA family TonB-linked outer membrane protein [Tunicatimonas pelagia]|uniref:SusC/RagA family TonB-linked outer membrane protein n=1 Tax=Tunicatimonas pelagia TaxID=931531 RepID=UPI002666C58F|nr:SusC/RagA family TonB-linked outer membrane protein [Tunicatimonas pelagia]WKN44034.1 SusC/RagA family TonB-linked outer membrane protein [Tunicatimonas pelagia]